MTRRRQSAERETIPEPIGPLTEDVNILRLGAGAIRLQYALNRIGATMSVNDNLDEITWTAPVERHMDASKLVSEWVRDHR